MRGRLAILIAVVGALAIACAAVVLVELAHVRSANRELVTELIPAQTDAAELGRLYRDLAVNIASSDASPDVIETAWRTTAELRDQMRPLVAGNQRSRDDFARVERAARAWIEVATPALDRPGAQAGAVELAELRDALALLSRHLDEAVADRQWQASEAAETARTALVVSAVALLGASLAGAVLLRRWIYDPIDDLTRQVGAVASGDLTRPIEPSGPEDLASVGVAVESMRRRLLDDATHRVDSALIAGHQAESARIAGQIHDDPVQVMTLASIRLQQLRRKVPADTELSELARSAEDATNQAIVRLRRMIFELHSPVLDTDGLAAAVEAYLDESFGDTVRWSVCGEPGDLSTGTAGLTYRLTREAMFNTFKHAEARSVAVSIERTPTTITVEVRDDGAGFDMDEIRIEPGHLGLGHSRELAAAAGGSWTCSSRPGEGTVVRFTLPVATDRPG